MSLGNRTKVLLVSAVVAVATAACGDDDNGVGPDPGPMIEGTYQLVTFEGAQVPTMIGQSGGCEQWVLSGTLTLASDRTHERTEVEEDRNCEDPADNDTRTVTNTGTWLLVESRLSLEEGTGGIESATADGTWDGGDTIELTFTRMGFMMPDTEIDRTYER